MFVSKSSQIYHLYFFKIIETCIGTIFHSNNYLLFAKKVIDFIVCNRQPHFQQIAKLLLTSTEIRIIWTYYYIELAISYVQSFDSKLHCCLMRERYADMALQTASQCWKLP